MAESSEEEFVDAVEEIVEVQDKERAEPVAVVVTPAAVHVHADRDGAGAHGVVGADAALRRCDVPIDATLAEPHPTPRESLAVQRPKGYSGLWRLCLMVRRILTRSSAMKSAVGKDLSKIAMPVQFNEPISFLQRLAEDLEYTSILDEAAEGHRVYKAFNPLLGETFELVRPEAGFRAVGEQVSHHPPITTLHAESQRGWILSEEYQCDTKFSIRGTLKVIPTGLCRLEIPKYGDRFTWIKPPTTVHNLIFGKVWLEQEGTVEVKNHSNGERCEIYWQTHSTAKDGYMHLTGKVFDANNVVRFTLRGGWDVGLALLPGDIPKQNLPKPAEAMANPAARVLWRALPTLPVAPVMYGLTKFAMSLNQPEENLCPTDSRLRPDQRLLEDAQMEPATQEKKRLEEKQRKVRKAREAAKIEHVPRWFEATVDPDTKKPFYKYSGGYWQAKNSGAFKDKSLWDDIF